MLTKEKRDLIEEKQYWAEAVKFAIVVGLSSRLLILLAMLAIAPALPVPSSGEPVAIGWQIFAHWDGEHYQRIVEQGYQFKNDGKGYNIAFFPLFPLLIRGLVGFGLPTAAAGVVINNLAFLAALVVLYVWVREQHSQAAARWAVIALAWSPFSLFGTVVYTEGLFLLCSTVALRTFDRRQYGWAALWGAATTAIRPPGMVLIPTFLLVSWLEKRGVRAYLASLISGTGLAVYMLYCWLRFQHPLAFVLTQRGWQSKQGFHGSAWIDLFEVVFLGPVNEDEGRLVDPWYPLALLLILGIGLLLWRSRHKLGFPRTGYGFVGLTLLLWLVGGSPLINVVMVFGGLYLLWRSRYTLSRLVLTYGFLSWGLILSIGKTTSTERYAYGVVSLAIALGLWLSRYPRWGYWAIGFCAILLASFSIRFAQGVWAG